MPASSRTQPRQDEDEGEESAVRLRKMLSGHGFKRAVPMEGLQGFQPLRTAVIRVARPAVSNIGVPSGIYRDRIARVCCYLAIAS